MECAIECLIETNTLRLTTGTYLIKLLVLNPDEINLTPVTLTQRKVLQYMRLDMTHSWFKHSVKRKISNPCQESNPVSSP
jgi:hypothetical protein